MTSRELEQAVGHEIKSLWHAVLSGDANTPEIYLHMARKWAKALKNEERKQAE